MRKPTEAPVSETPEHAVRIFTAGPRNAPYKRRRYVPVEADDEPAEVETREDPEPQDTDRD